MIMPARCTIAMLLAAAWALAPFGARAESSARSNGVPLVFGMNAEQVSASLGVPLIYVHGGPAKELLLAVPNVKGSALSSRSDGLYLQFRSGRLTGWKGDWGTIRP